MIEPTERTQLRKWAIEAVLVLNDKVQIEMNQLLREAQILEEWVLEADNRSGE